MGGRRAGQADVSSLQSVVALEAALSRFAARAPDAVGALTRRAEARIAAYESQVDDARQALAEAIGDLDSADEDDDLEWRLDAVVAARAQLRNKLRWEAEVESAAAAHRRAAARFMEARETLLVRATADLRLRIQSLKEYLAISLPSGEATSEPGPPVAPAGVAGTETAVPQPPTRLVEFRLPPGFAWVPLTDVTKGAKLDPIGEPLQFEKVAYEAMKAGMMRLRSEVLPRLHSADMPLASDEFRQVDKEKGQGYEDGVQRIYDAFFGQDVIYLVRRRGEKEFEVTNGRHRIRVASDLGWEAVPAKVKVFGPGADDDAFGN